MRHRKHSGTATLWCICGLSSANNALCFVPANRCPRPRPTGDGGPSMSHGFTSRRLGPDQKWKHLLSDRPSSPNVLSATLSPNDAELAFWVAAFSFSHIGMSAVRSSIISYLGRVLSSPPLNLVGREEWRLPAWWWFGDSTGGDRIFPDADTAGRQIYRAAYTLVSFFTLGSAFAAYVDSSADVGSASSIVLDQSDRTYSCCLAVAALSQGASISSLFNASPLGLMPGFESAKATNAQGDAPTGTLGLRRDDSLKFTVRGLTRITRHPLILPVVPWGVATSYLAGGRLCDTILFAGLSVYAVAGCFAQDLRVSKNEGSVGTVFRPIDSEQESKTLRTFFEQTSFIPFGAVYDGRQSMADVLTEVPWLQFIFGCFLGIYIEQTFLNVLESFAAIQ